MSVLISVLWYGAEHMDAWNLDTILFWDSEGVSIAVPILIYGYDAVPILPSVEDSMREKHKFPRALALAYNVNIMIKFVFSVFTFLTFGFNTDHVILNNLPAGPFRMSISFLFVLRCILSYALPLDPLLDFLQRTEVIDSALSRIPIMGSSLIRITVVLSTVLGAILVPKFALVVSSAGSMIGSFTAYIFPCAIHLKLKFKELKACEVFLDLLLTFIAS